MPNRLHTLINEFNLTGLSSIGLKDVTRKKRIIAQMSNNYEITINDISESLKYKYT
jgi:hypothetical protein